MNEENQRNELKFNFDKVRLDKSYLKLIPLRKQLDDLYNELSKIDSDLIKDDVSSVKRLLNRSNFASSVNIRYNESKNALNQIIHYLNGAKYKIEVVGYRYIKYNIPVEVKLSVSIYNTDDMRKRNEIISKSEFSIKEEIDRSHGKTTYIYTLNIK